MAAETVLITGASSGIGLELAHLFASDRAGLILVARSADELEGLAREIRARREVPIRILAEDLGRPEAPGRIAQQLSRDRIAVDVLVNCAGFGARGAVAELPLERQLEMVQVNVAALTHLTRLLLPGMIERRLGGVLNVASTAAFQPGPNMAVYYATKAYVLSFSEALSDEVAGTGVRICCLAPGPTTTGFQKEAGMEGTRLVRSGSMAASAVARAGHRGFRAGRSLVVPGLRNKIGVFLVRLLPRSVPRKIVRWLQS